MRNPVPARPAWPPLPTAPHIRLVLWRGAWLWLSARVAMHLVGSIVFTAMGMSPPTLRLGAVASTGLVLGCGVLIALDVLRRRERVLFANTGVSVPAVFALGAGPGVAAELAVNLVLPA